MAEAALERQVQLVRHLIARRLWTGRLRASDDHHSLDEVCFVGWAQLDVLLFQTAQSVLYNCHCALHNQFTGVYLRLRLLNLRQTLGHFGVVCNLHDIHSLDFNAGNVTAELEHVLQVSRYDGGVVAQ